MHESRLRSGAGRGAADDAVLQRLRDGGVAALPTDTVPGLAVRADAEDAAGRLSALKGAPSDRPYSLHFAALADLRRRSPLLPPGLAPWLHARLPGPWTAVLPRAWIALPDAWSAPWPAVGVRVPGHRRFAALAERVGAPLYLTSINDHGEPPRSGRALWRWLEEHDVPAPADLEEGVRGDASGVVRFEPLPRVVRGEVAAEELRVGRRVLVVCSGNICRSPLAVAMLRAELAAAWGVDPEDLAALGWEVASAGTHAMPGAPASEHSVTAAAEIGLDLADHRARAADEAAADGRWDLILGMGPQHLPQATPDGTVAELFDATGAAVPDPFGGGLDDYRRMREHLRRAVRARVEAWSRWPRA